AASAAHAEATHIDVEMIMVGRVVLGAQGNPEGIAGSRFDLAQEARPIVVAVPVAGNGDARAVLQAKASQVQRVGRRMLAASIAAGNVATGEAAEVVDLHHSLAEHSLRRRLQSMAF